MSAIKHRPSTLSSSSSPLLQRHHAARRQPPPPVRRVHQDVQHRQLHVPPLEEVPRRAEIRSVLALRPALFGSLADARAHARACAQTQTTRGTRRVSWSSKRRPERVASARTTTRTSVPVRLRFSLASCAPRSTPRLTCRPARSQPHVAPSSRQSLGLAPRATRFRLLGPRRCATRTSSSLCALKTYRERRSPTSCRLLRDRRRPSPRAPTRRSCPTTTRTRSRTRPCRPS